MSHSKEVEEKEIFMMFAKICPLNIIPISIENRMPPEPDILCQSIAAGWISFEMVRLDYEKFTQVISEKIKLREKFYASCKGLSGSLRLELIKKFGGCSVSVAFRPVLTPGEWKEAIPCMLDFLLNEPSSGAKNIRIQDYPKLRSYVEEMRVERGDAYPSEAPSLYVIEATEVVNRAQERLAQKFAKTYESKHPIELLAYYDLQLPPQSSGWMSQIGVYVDEHLRNSNFRRVWVFDCLKRAIRFEKEVLR